MLVTSKGRSQAIAEWYTEIWEVFGVKIFSYREAGMKIKRTKILYTRNICIHETFLHTKIIMVKAYTCFTFSWGYGEAKVPN